MGWTSTWRLKPHGQKGYRPRDCANNTVPDVPAGAEIHYLPAGCWFSYSFSRKAAQG